MTEQNTDIIKDVVAVYAVADDPDALAGRWVEAGFTDPDEVRAWFEAGCHNPELARDLVRAELDPRRYVNREPEVALGRAEHRGAPGEEKSRSS